MARIVEVDVGNGQVARVTRPDRDDFDDNLGGAVQFGMANALSWLIEHTGNALGTFLGGGLVGFLETIEPHLVEYYSPMIDALLEAEDIPSWFKEFLEKLKEPTSEAGTLVGQAVLGSAAGATTASLLGVALSGVTMAMNRMFHPQRPPLPDALAMEWRGGAARAITDRWIEDQGWDDDIVDLYRVVLRPRVPIADLIAWWWRTGEEKSKVELEMTARGYTEDERKKLFALAKRIPSPGDLVTFALREVWIEAFRPELLKPDAHPKFYELMAKQGYDKETAQDYWAAHWRLPSTRQGFEMFWRLPEFTEDDLRQLMTRLDILPRYHDGLIKIAYTPLTRVDVRRIHATGQILSEDLPRQYGNVGFSPEDAQIMANFTIAYNARTDSEYTKTEVLKAYRVRMLEPSEAFLLLKDVGLAEDYAIFLLAFEDYKRDLDIQEQQIDIIEDRYVRHEIDATTARGRLAGLNLKGAHIERLLEEWGIKRRAKIALPTRANIEEFYKDGVIDEQTARLELLKRRYPEYAIDWWIHSWDQQIAEAAQKEAERAQTEEERMAKAKFRTDRSIALSKLGRIIAELNLLIAETKLAIYDMEGREEYEIIRSRIAELWTDYWAAETDAERAAIQARMDALYEQAGLLDTDIANAERNILVAKRDIKGLQLEKARLPVVLEERR